MKLCNKFKPQNFNLLIVDDEEDFLEILEEDLSDEGYNVTVANSGNKAIEILNEKKIDLIISDVTMPEGNGVFLLDKISQKYPERPILIFMTGFANVSDADVYDRGAEGIFHKPIDIDRLLKGIEFSLTPKEDKYKKFHRNRSDLNVIKIQDNYWIERGGFTAETNEKLTKYEEINFEIVPENNLYGLGIVRWIKKVSSDKYRFGCEFLHFDNDNFIKYEKIVDKKKCNTFIKNYEDEK